MGTLKTEEIDRVVSALRAIKKDIERSRTARRKALQPIMDEKQLVRIHIDGKRQPVVGFIRAVDGDLATIETTWSVVKYPTERIDEIDVRNEDERRFRRVATFHA